MLAHLPRLRRQAVDEQQQLSSDSSWAADRIAAAAADPARGGRRQDNNAFEALVHALTWAFNHFVFEGLTVFLLQKGAGSRAIAHAFKISVVWAALTLALQFLVFWKGFPSTASHTL